ncbi:sulfur carrier protein ThiS [Weissella sagaensis]|uniref:Sulfur carrier protein ThiS n=1 Tax=Weissella sagaensis TaxID=2559928 RepID=A0ABW1RVA9_9LACO|nr:sulfur carrier protein ThiS [Weissella sagaensis]QDJ59681.1 sulfur carrier protein ThiS [Weissella hellenica]QEA56995.1 sulfur carrier protein ThiS [Weissella hellenica]UEG67809.1 sulfur carrier protein ThiS [Weissella hellenica]
MINVNGKPMDQMVGKTLTDLLKAKTSMMQNVVVELNGEIIHRDQLDTKILVENDKVELISFVGGG